MKKLMVLGFLATLNAMALSPASSWSEIFADASARFYADYNLGGIALSNACLTDTEVHSINPVKVCVKEETVSYGSDENGSPIKFNFCKEYATVAQSSPRTYNVDSCVQWKEVVQGSDVGSRWECVASAPKAVTVPNTFNVGVYEDQAGGSDGGGSSTFPGFTKALSLPACAK